MFGPWDAFLQVFSLSLFDAFYLIFTFLYLIFLELLGMQVESIKDYHDRAALFPGKSCYPLSGDHLDKVESISFSPDHAKDRVDQLSIIFDVIGSPTEADIEQISDVHTREFLRRVEPNRPTVELSCSVFQISTNTNTFLILFYLTI